MALFGSEFRTLILDNVPLIKTMSPEALQRDALLPGIEYTAIETTRDLYMTGTSSFTFKTIQLDVWDNKYRTCREAANQLATFLHNLSTTTTTYTIQLITIEQDRDGEAVDETDSQLKHQIILEADIHYHTTPI